VQMMFTALVFLAASAADLVPQQAADQSAGHKRHFHLHHVRRRSAAINERRNRSSSRG